MGALRCVEVWGRETEEEELQKHLPAGRAGGRLTPELRPVLWDEGSQPTPA